MRSSDCLQQSLLRQEKDEASPSRLCGSGFAECLHSLFCRDEGFFVSTDLVLVLVVAVVSSGFEDEEDEEEDELISSRSGLSITNPFADFISANQLKDQL